MKSLRSKFSVGADAVCTLVACVGLLAFPKFVYAQTTYRCGNTFSQIPCAADAKPNRISGATAPDAAPGPQGEELCTSLAPTTLHLIDPEAARIRSIVKAGAEAITYADKPTVSHRFDMVINAKNADGAYSGDRSYACFLSEDEHRLLKMEASNR